jgi:uncharacterized protein YcfJ
MRTGILTTIAAVASLSPLAAIAHGGPNPLYGRVVDVQPIVHRIVVERPRRECWQDVEYRPVHSGRVAGTTLAGGVIGAAIGRQFGDGSGRDALTLLGAVAGSAVANDRARRNQALRGDDGVVRVPVERCEVIANAVSESRVTGYWVTYRFRGRLHRVRTYEHPGRSIRLDRLPVARVRY